MVSGAGDHMVGFHNFNLRMFNLRVSNPNKLIVDVFLDTTSDFNVPGSRPNKNTMKFLKSTVIIIILTISPTRVNTRLRQYNTFDACQYFDTCQISEIDRTAS